MLKHQRVVLFLAAGLLGSCRLFEPEAGEERCASQYGTTGCAVVTGRVVFPTGEPRVGAIAGWVEVQRRDVALQSFGREVDADGRFRVQVLRTQGGPPATGEDTVSALVRVAARVTADTTYVRSRAAVLRFRPAGAPVEVTDVGTIAIEAP